MKDETVLYDNCPAWSAGIGILQVRGSSFKHFSDWLQLVRGPMVWS